VVPITATGTKGKEEGKKIFEERKGRRDQVYNCPQRNGASVMLFKGNPTAIFAWPKKHLDDIHFDREIPLKFL